MHDPLINTTAKPAPAPPPIPPRAALEFAIEGDTRFISHHDTMRALARALTRADWPVAYSAGFNPLPRLSLPLPRSVGMAASRELAVIDLRDAADPDALFESLAPRMPRGMTVVSVASPLPRGTPHAVGVEYEMELGPAEVDLVAPRIPMLLEAANCVIDRDHGPDKPRSSLDIRPFIEELRLDKNVLRLRCSFEHQRTARPAEVLTNLGLSPECAHRVRRVRIDWDMPLAALSCRRGQQERENRGQEDHA